jgi:type VI secretion system protein ImpH
MADDARLPRPDLSGASHDGVAMDFFELLRRLEGPGQRFGRAGGPEREPARLGQDARLAFAAGDVARVEPSRSPGRPAEVVVELIGLLGPEGPMPLHLTRWVFERVSQRWFTEDQTRATSDTAFLDFCNLMQHRMIALYWRAWADARPAVHAERDLGGRVGATVAALAGLGLPGTRGVPGPSGASDGLRMFHAPAIAASVHGTERLAGPLSDLLGAPVAIVEFVGTWTVLPERLQTRLGKTHSRLGEGAVAGARVYGRTGRIELRVGPVDLALFRRIAGDTGLRDRIRHLVLALIGREIEVDLRPVLAAADVPPPRLGDEALGRSLWLPARTSRDRDDLRLSRITSETVSTMEERAA